MDKEPYEKPEVTTIDLGNLIDEAEKDANLAAERAAAVRSRLEDLLADLAFAEGELAEMQRGLEEIKKKHLIASIAIERQTAMVVKSEQ